MVAGYKFSGLEAGDCNAHVLKRQQHENTVPHAARCDIFCVYADGPILDVWNGSRAGGSTYTRVPAEGCCTMNKNIRGSHSGISHIRTLSGL